MPLDITLRTSHLTSPFRDRLLLLCRRNLGSHLILTSGFFQQGLWGYDVLQDDLLNAITAPQSGITTIDVIGEMAGHGQWVGGFNRFVTALRQTNQFHVSAWIARTRKWHAKIAMRINKKGPTAAIIGSSNLTRPPNGTAPMIGPRGWNYECDVTLWKDTKGLNRVFRSGDTLPDDEWVIAAIRDPKVRQPDEGKRLKQLFAYLEVLIRGAKAFRGK